MKSKEDKGVESLQKALKNKKIRIIAMLAPSFIAEFSYPEVISQLKELGFDKITELTFGAKMINRDYHEQLKQIKESGLLISTVCPGIVSTIKSKFPKYAENLAKIDSPMIATAKICKKFYPKHKTCFLSPCFFKKVEAENSEYVDYVITYQELHLLLDSQPNKNHNSPHSKKNLAHTSASFDKFYNDYTKIYPLSGGLSKTAHLKEVLKPGQEKIIDGILEVEKFLKKYNKKSKIRFLDVTFCKGGCIGGPCVTTALSLEQKKKKILDYMEKSKHEDIPEAKKGLIEKAKGIKFSW
jgi:iron only hydrogenase large subunit-like protein